jgi:8-oxo-dGTP diphosphatase
MTNEQLTIVVAMVRDDSGKILIAKRKDALIPDADGKWEYVGGKIDFGEEPEDAIIREVQEESGLEVRIEYLLPKVYTNMWSKVDGAKRHAIILTYVCKVTGRALHTESFDHKITELKFIEPREIYSHPLLAKCKEIMDTYLETIPKEKDLTQ